MSASNVSSSPRPRSFEITGRMVLVAFLAFFGVVTAVNAVMIRAALSTFGGVETKSSYKAGLAFAAEAARARAQEARHWQVTAQVTPGFVADDARSLTVSVRDAQGRPVTGGTVTGRLAHPADSRRDHALALEAIAPGVYRGVTEAEPGQWDLEIDILENGERLFRTRNRIALP